MQQTYLLVQKGMVVDAVVWDGDTSQWEPPAGLKAIALPPGLNAGIGWSYDGARFIAPAPPSVASGA